MARSVGGMNAPVAVTAAFVFKDVKTMNTKGATHISATITNAIHSPIKMGSRFDLGRRLSCNVIVNGSADVIVIDQPLRAAASI
jgi:hypothetical protein